MAKIQDDKQQKLWLRHKRIYEHVVPLLGKWITKKFNFVTDGFDPLSVEGPILVIPNHS